MFPRRLLLLTCLLLNVAIALILTFSFCETSPHPMKRALPQFSSPQVVVQNWEVLARPLDFESFDINRPPTRNLKLETRNCILIRAREQVVFEAKDLAEL